MKSLNVGVVGCGHISDIYFKNSSTYQTFNIVACADLDNNLAKKKADLYDISNVPVEDMMIRPDIDLIVNLTPPAAHAEVTLKGLYNNKHVYSEKPLAIDLEDGRRIISVAEERHLQVGVAPDTFLGAGIQTCQDLMAQDAIGAPLAGSAFLLKLGPERWHENPEFFYQKGGGPLFDMGPYYLTTLVQLLGPIRSVMAVAKTNPADRRIVTGPKKGTKLNVDIPTHYSGILQFEEGPIVTMTMSFDVPATDTPLIEIYGETGTLKVPDPNTFGGPVLLKKKDEEQWTEVELTHPYSQNSRGLGIADMVDAIQHQTSFKTNGRQALHVLEAMHAFHESSESGKQVRLHSLESLSTLLETKG